MKAWKQILLALVRISLGVIFLYSAYTKLPDMRTFAEELANYRLVPAQFVPAVASAVVGTEIVAGIGLVVGVLTQASAWTIAGLLVVFIVGISQALLRGIDLRCGCFGGTEMAGWDTVLRDVPMLAGALAIMWLGPGRLIPKAASDTKPAG